jgi:hypothetical protein
MSHSVKNKARFWAFWLALLAACFLVFVTYRFSSEELKVDRCLSGNHGSFNYSNMTCDLETNHPYVPYLARHPLDIWIATLAIVCFLPFLSDYFKKRTNQKA